MLQGQIRLLSSRATDSIIAKAEFAHRSRIEQIASVEDDRRVHLLLHLVKADVVELTPFSCQNERFRIASGLKGTAVHRDAWTQLELFNPVHSFRVISLDDCPFPQQVICDLDSDRTSHVIGIRLKRQPPDRYLLVFEHPKRVPNLLNEPFALRLVDLLYFL